jgi:hypothetical protein
MASSIDEEWSMFLQNQGICMYSEKEATKNSLLEDPSLRSGEALDSEKKQNFPSQATENWSSPSLRSGETLKYTKKSVINRMSDDSHNSSVHRSDEKMNCMPENLSTLRSDKFIFGFDRVSAKTVNFPTEQNPDEIRNSPKRIDEKTPRDVKIRSDLVAPMKNTETFDESSIPRPICEDLHISTKTKVLFFNQPVDIQNVFWKIPIIEYWKPEEGVIKKQIKIVCKTPEETEEYKEKLKTIKYYREHIIKQVDNPTARVLKYKDERKITIGISKKDIINLRGKIKNAFYNCFVIIIRFKYEEVFREIHVKVFNTGKMEVPGVFNRDQLDIVKNKIMTIIEPILSTLRDSPEPAKEKTHFSECEGKLRASPERSEGEDQFSVACEGKLEIIEPLTDENVLINSNFNCGYYIDREKLHNILNSKYGIECSYDPCSYPGVKCKYYFNNKCEAHEQDGQISNEDRKMKMSELGDYKKYTEVSFMIFRTGSCLIVGNCSENILRFIFDFLKKLLYDEYPNISIINENTSIKEKKVKQKKKKIIMTPSYFDKISSVFAVTNDETKN